MLPEIGTMLPFVTFFFFLFGKNGARLNSIMEDIRKMPAPILLFILFTFLIPTKTLVAQETDWVALGDSMVWTGRFKAAKKAYEEALKRDKDFIPAYKGLGQLALELRDWGDLNGSYGEILKRDPDNFEAHYYAGIGHRESGKLKALFLRRSDFNKARDHFQWIVQRDSAYQDVLFQWAVLKRFEEKYTEAIVMGHEQLRLTPHQAKANTGLFSLYQTFLRHKGDRDVISWLNQQPWPHARYFVGEVFRRKGEYESAMPIFDSLLTDPKDLNRQPVYLSLARIYFDEGDPVKGENCFWKAVDDIKTRADAELIFEDLKYIVTDEELKRFDSLMSSSEFQSFFHTILARRDPTPAAKHNVRLAEHYRRLNHAEKYYEFDGVRSWFNNPDKSKQLPFPAAYFANEELNDKGLVYIRHGEPDDRVVTLGESVTTNESWLYYETTASARMAFHFLIDENAAGNNWRLTPVISNAEMLSDRTHWGSVYHRMLNSNLGTRMGAELDMLNESIEAVEIGFSTDHHTFDDNIKPLDMPYYAASFRAPDGSTQLEVYYGFPIEQVARELPGEEKEARVERGFAISDRNWQPLDKYTDTLQVPFSHDTMKETDLIIDLFRATMPADSYQVGFHVSPNGTHRLGGYNFPMRLPAFSDNELDMSDILLAFSIGPAQNTGKFTRHGLKVVPNPSLAYLLESPVSAYFEVYNLTKGRNGATSFTVEFTLAVLKKKGGRGLKNLFGLLGGGGKSSISLSSARAGTTGFSPEFVTFDVSKMSKGNFDLTVKIIDNHSGESVEKHREIVLY